MSGRSNPGRFVPFYTFAKQYIGFCKVGTLTLCLSVVVQNLLNIDLLFLFSSTKDDGIIQKLKMGDF